ncbi:MAG: hypothetical protein NVS3B7_19460 [Candidatus Elarobacter sp.]
MRVLMPHGNGATTPLIARFGATAGPWTAAALLDLGAAAVAVATLRHKHGHERSE